MKTLYLAGGCFWGMERFFSLAKGVVETRVGYANGNKPNPSYEDLKAGRDSSAETLRLVYDERVISLEKVLELFLRVVDPYSINKQGEDEGLQYRSGIYYESEVDRNIILRYLADNLDKPYAIEVLPLKAFYDAEEYHQEYLVKNPTGYCHISMAKLRDDERK